MKKKSEPERVYELRIPITVFGLDGKKDRKVDAGWPYVSIIMSAASALSAKVCLQWALSVLSSEANRTKDVKKMFRGKVK